MWVVQEGLGAWDPKFLRLFDDWEMDAIQAFIGFVSNCVITPLVKDKLIWKSDVSGCFTINAYFNHLDGAPPPPPPPPPVQSPPKCFGIPMSLQKLVFFAWEALWGQSPHCFSIEEKGFLPSKQVLVLREEGIRAGAYSDPLSFNLGSVN